MSDTERPRSDEIAPVVMRRKPTEMTCFIWTSEDATLPLQQWLSKETGLTHRQVADQLFFPWSREHGNPGTARLWVNKSQTFCSIKHGDAVVRESDRTGFYPVAADVLASTYEAT